MPTIRVNLSNEQYEHLLKLADAAECEVNDVLRTLIDLDRKSVSVDKKSLSVLEEQERDLIVSMLETCKGNVSAAAKNLAEHRRTLQRKMKRFGIVAADYRL